MLTAREQLGRRFLLARVPRCLHRRGDRTCAGAVEAGLGAVGACAAELPLPDHLEVRVILGVVAHRDGVAGLKLPDTENWTCPRVVTSNGVLPSAGVIRSVKSTSGVKFCWPTSRNETSTACACTPASSSRRSRFLPPKSAISVVLLCADNRDIRRSFYPGCTLQLGRGRQRPAKQPPKTGSRCWLGTSPRDDEVVTQIYLISSWACHE